jgi:hypothetical protein
MVVGGMEVVIFKIQVEDHSITIFSSNKYDYLENIMMIKN